MREVYRLFVNCNPNTAGQKNMKVRLPTAPMFVSEDYNDMCYYRLNRVILESADTELDENTLVVELNVPSRSCITIPLTQSDIISDASGTGLVSFLTEITGDTDSCKFYNRQVDNACIGNNMWGNTLEFKFYRIALATGVKTIWTADQDLLMEIEIEPCRKY